MKEEMSVVLRPKVCGNVLQQPQETNTPCGLCSANFTFKKCHFVNINTCQARCLELEYLIFPMSIIPILEMRTLGLKKCKEPASGHIARAHWNQVCQSLKHENQQLKIHRHYFNASFGFKEVLLP